MPPHGSPQNTSDALYVPAVGEALHLLKVKEAAEVLRMDAADVYRAIRTGETFGDSVRKLPGQRTRFSRKRLLAYIDGE